MRAIKIILLAVTLMTAGLTLKGCDQDNSTPHNGVEQNKDKGNNGTQSASNSESPEDGNILAYISICLSVASLVAIGATYFKLNKRANRHGVEIRKANTEIHDLKDNYSSQNIQTPQPSGSVSGINKQIRELTEALESVKKRISKLEVYINQLAQNSAVKIPSPTPEERRAPIPVPETGYFSGPIQMSPTEAYLKRLMSRGDSDTRFTAVITSDKAQFTPLTDAGYINYYLSWDNIRLAIEIQGATPPNASQMTVIEPGKAERQAGDRWIITKKAKVSFKG